MGGASNPELTVEGASYDPAAGEWHRLPRSPGDFAAGHTSVWTGDELLVWGGRTRGVAFDPRRAAWRDLPRSPLVERTEHIALWTSRQMLIWGGEACVDGCYRADGATYMP